MSSSALDWRPILQVFCIHSSESCSSCIVAEPEGVLRTFFPSGLMLGMAKHSSTARKRCPVSFVWECFWRIEDVCYSELCTKDGGKIVDCCSLVLALILCVHGLPVSSRAQQICSKSAPSWSAIIVLSMRSANIAARNRQPLKSPNELSHICHKPVKRLDAILRKNHWNEAVVVLGTN